MKTTIRISEGAEINRLAAQICIQTIRDLLYSRSPIKKLDAFLFLVSPDFQVWSEAGRLDFADPFRLLSNLREVKKKLQKRSKK